MVRDLSSALRPSKQGGDLVAEMASLQRHFYTRGVLLVVFAPADGELSNSPSNKKRFDELRRRVLATPGLDLLLCQDQVTNASSSSSSSS